MVYAFISKIICLLLLQTLYSVAECKSNISPERLTVFLDKFYNKVTEYKR